MSGRCVANSPVESDVTSAPSGCASMKSCITATSCSEKLGGMYTVGGSARGDGLDAGVPEIARCHLGEVRERDLRFVDLRMPALLPLQAVVALVARAGERLDLLLHRHLATSSQNVLPAVARRHRVLEVRVPDPAAELRYRRLRRLLGDERVMGIPQNPHRR